MYLVLFWNYTSSHKLDEFLIQWRLEKQMCLTHTMEFLSYAYVIIMCNQRTDQVNLQSKITYMTSWFIHYCQYL